MKKYFKDPIEVKDNQKKVKSPWSFDAPQYDQRSSCFVNAGTNYGMGHRQPVGSLEGNLNDKTVPQGVHNFELSDKGYHIIEDDKL